jgi:hypothetical protein
LRLLDARMPEHQLDDADVHTVGQEAAGALVTRFAETLPSSSKESVYLWLTLRPMVPRLVPGR